VVANSFTAHRLIHLAAAHGKQDAAKERLLSDHFEHGKDIGSRDYLASLGEDLGLDAGEVAELFSTDKYAEDVRRDFAEARALGISGVPFFVIDRKYGLSGAQPAATFSAALEQAWQEAHPLVMVGSPNSEGGAAGAGADGAEACGPDGCPV
jgi:predicted DsbA family dithiol-disulfide isomerase